MDFVIFLVGVAVLAGVFVYNKRRTDVFHIKQGKIMEAINALEAQLKALKK